MNTKAQIRVMLTDEELQIPAVDDLFNKYNDWVKLAKESAGGRKTRAANRRADTIYEEIMNFKLPPIKIESPPVSPTRSKTVTYTSNNSAETSIDSESGPSASGRTLRPRCRTPSVSRKADTSPSTPAHQSIRAQMKKNLDSNSSNVLNAALNQEHPSVSLVKIRQLLRADSAQKKREEERERQERAMLERKAKEQKAEAQKKKMLEERAQAAKLNREQRLQHAAEVRKAREKAKVERKLREAIPNVNKKQSSVKQVLAEGTQALRQEDQQQQLQQHQIQEQNQHQQQQKLPPQPQLQPQSKQQQISQPRKLDETFQRPNDNDNIEISIHEETCDEPNKKANSVAAWAKAPHFRDAVIEQFSKGESELSELTIEIFGGVKLPVDLDQIFASHKPVNTRYLARTSSAVWTPPRKPLKRSTSEVTTPVDQSKRPKDNKQLE